MQFFPKHSAINKKIEHEMKWVNRAGQAWEEDKIANIDLTFA